jgi:beta-lactamase regulating signal transducer with metallopeptidase domain
VTDVLEVLLGNAVTAAAFAAVVLVLCRLLRPSPAARHALWLVVVVKLLCPVGLLWSVPLPLEEPRLLGGQTNRGPNVPGLANSPAETAYPEALPVYVATLTTDPGEGPPAVAGAADHGRVKGAAGAAGAGPPVSGTRHAGFGTPAAESEGIGPPLWWWVQVLWLAGAVVVAARYARRTARFSRYARSGKPPAPSLQRQVAELAAVVGVRAPPVRVLAGLPSPVVWCLFRPVLLWPKGLQGQLRGGGRRAVLVHELAHLRRRDHWVRWLELAAAALHWWNPLFWFVRRQLRFCAELACDAWVTGTLPEARRDYAEALLKVCARPGRSAAPSPAVGVGGDGRRDFRRRLTMIMRDQVPCRLAAGAKLLVVLLLLAALPAWTLGQGQADPGLQPKVETKTVVVKDPKPAVVGVFDVVFERPGAGADVAKKAKALEARIAELQKELQALQAAKAAAGQKKQTERVRVWELQGAGPARAVRVLTVDPATGKVIERKAGTPQAGWTVKPLGGAGTPPRYKVIGPDGKEIKGAKVIVVGPKQTAAPPATTWAEVAREIRARPNGTVRLWDVAPAPADKVIHLSRATYRLPKGKAAALAAFLKDNVKASVLELKVEEPGLTVTTTPETQAAVGGIVRLMAQGQVGVRTTYRIRDLRIVVPDGQKK